MDIDMELDLPMLKVPVAELMTQFRNSKKLVDRTFTSVISGLGVRWENISHEEGDRILTGLIKQLQSLQQKLGSSRRSEEEALARLRARLEHLVKRNEMWPRCGSGRSASDACQGALGDVEEGDDGVASRMDCDGEEDAPVDGKWNELRLDRFIADYMLREGYHDSASMLIEQSHLEDYVDAHIFADSRKAIEALMRHDCSEALKWCNENRRRLLKVGSKLPLKLRVQEFVELCRVGQRREAVDYARLYLAPLVEENFEEIYKVMGLLAFPADTKCEQYAWLYSADRWADAITQFKEDYYELHGLTCLPLIEVALKIGMSAFKTPNCFREEAKNVNCPTCTQPFNALAESLPFSQHAHSKLVCAITGKVMNENNPPLVLPNGNVYSESGLKLIAQGKGFVVDPRTQQTFSFPSLDIVKVFVM